MSALSIINARIIDPTSGYDGGGTLLCEDGIISKAKSSMQMV